MKTLYTLIGAAILCTTPATAQFTMLQQYHQPTPATGQNQADVVRYDSIGALPKNTGQGQSWDFSAMLITTNKRTCAYIAASSAPHASLFASADIAEVTGGTTHKYFDSDSVAKTFALVGMASGSQVLTFSNPKLELRFPIAFDSTWNDAYNATAATMTVSGTYSVRATGMGNLTLVGGKMFSNVMQIKSWDNMQVAGTAPSTVNITKYAYYHSLNRYPLITVTYSAVATETLTEIYVNWLEAVGVTENNLDAPYAIYPNPATTLVSVDLMNLDDAPCSFGIYTTTGQLVKNIELGSARHIVDRIDVSDLPRGLYIVKTMAGSKSGTRKLIVE